MRVRIQRRGLVPAAVVAVLGTLVLYLAVTSGLAAWHRHDATEAPSARGYFPSVVENAPPSVPTTDEYGPGGPVALVYAGSEVAQGLTGSLPRPWLTVSAATGEYRALSAPDLPDASPGAVRVSPDGTWLAWAADDGLHVLDTTTGEVSLRDVSGVTAVGPFSDDGELVLVHAGDARVVRVRTGEVLAVGEATPAAVVGAAWRPDDEAADLVTPAGLLTLRADGASRTTPSHIPVGAQLAWSPEGDRLADLRDESGTWRLHLSELRADGSWGPARRVAVPGVSMQRLLGFSGARTVAVHAFLLESGNVERVLDVSLDRGSTTQLSTLPPTGVNWEGAGTMSVATDTLVRGSIEWEPNIWPWSHAARLVACALLMFFLFGLYATRRPRER